MNRAMLKQYTKLVEFLGLVLGPTYEITLHDVHGKNSTIVAIVNGSVSGRDLDSPPTAMALRAVAENVYMENNIVIRSDVLESLKEEDTERFGDSMTSAADSVIEEVLSEGNIPVERLSQEEKIRIVAQLERRGIFRLKGAVAHVSKELHSSPASIYRYLTRVRQETD